MQAREGEAMRQEMISQIQTLANELGRTPGFVEFKADSRTVSAARIFKEFGTWNNFLIAAGFIPTKGGDISTLLIEQVQDLAATLGRVPTKAEFDQARDTFSAGRARRVFGSWTQLLEAADLIPKGSMRFRKIRNPYSNEEIISQVRLLANKLNRTPTQMEFINKLGSISKSGIYQRFGSWSNLLKQAGLKPTRRFKVTDDELVSLVRTLAKELGKTPTAGEFARSDYAVNTNAIIYHFGSWDQFLREAGLEAR